MHTHKSNAIALFAGAAALALGAGQAPASLLIDVRVLSVVNGTIVDSKTVLVAGHARPTITMGVFAQVTGSDSGKSQSLQMVAGSFLSGPGGYVSGLLQITALDPAFATGSQASRGLFQDLDGDGDVDTGSNDATSSENFFRAQAANPIGPRTSGVNATLNGATIEYRIATLRFIAQSEFGESSPFATVNFRRLITAGGAAWIEDATETNVGTEENPIYTYSGGTLKDPTTGSLQVGPNLSFYTNDVPEPGCIGLISLCGTVVLSRRRRV